MLQGPVAGAAALIVDSESKAAKDFSLVVPIEHGTLSLGRLPTFCRRSSFHVVRPERDTQS